MAITLLVTDRDLTVVGDPIANWTKVDVTLRFNEPGSGSFTAPARPELMALLAGGNRIVVIRDGAVFMAGPYEHHEFTWEVGADPGEVTVSFAEDLALIAGRVTYPDPALVATSTSQPAYRTFSGTNAEDVMRALVDENAGPGALTVREVPQLVLGADAGVGGNINLRTRFEPLCDALRSAAIVGGGLGFRTVQTSTAIEFRVYDPQDLSGTVRFSRGLGNLRKIQYRREAPRVTAAIVGGAGEGDAREIRERLSSGAISTWWRLESFVDQRQTGDDTELDQAGDEALVEGAERGQLQITTVDTPDQRYGEHYGLGDIVSVEVTPGFEVADVVRAVQLVATPLDGEVVTPTVGTQEATSDPMWIRQMRALDRRLSKLEAI